MHVSWHSWILPVDSHIVLFSVSFFLSAMGIVIDSNNDKKFSWKTVETC